MTKDKASELDRINGSRLESALKYVRLINRSAKSIGVTPVEKDEFLRPLYQVLLDDGASDDTSPAPAVAQQQVVYKSPPGSLNHFIDEIEHDPNLLMSVIRLAMIRLEVCLADQGVVDAEE